MSVENGNRDKNKRSIGCTTTTNNAAVQSSTAGFGRLLRHTMKPRTPPPSPSPRTGATEIPLRSTLIPMATGMATGLTGLMDSIHVATRSTTSAAASSTTTASTPTALFQNLHSALSHHSSSRQIPMSKAPIRLTGLAWKRRGGMGKYATSGSWERRRIELQGTRILYYAKDETDDVRDDDDEAYLSASPSQLENGTTTRQSSKRDVTSGEDVGEGVVVARQSNWFEYAFSGQHEDPNSPRGFLDLAKEKASVHAALGHGGAPTPFAISIKVRGETKWKFCFDEHREQMEWLAALTDVVVQNSVDVYNATVLDGADPTHKDGLSILTSSLSSQAKPRSCPENGGGTRLWQVQPYTISSQATRDDDDYEDNDDEIEMEQEEEDAAPDHPTEGDHMEAQRLATEESTQHWVASGNNLVCMAIVLNAAAAMARLSTLSVEGFWFLVVFTNAALYCCLTKEPDWKSVVTYVRASPDDNKKGMGVSGKINKDKAVASHKTETASTSSKARSIPEFKPIAGTTTVKLKNPTDLPVNDKNEVFAGWRCPPGDAVMVRSHGYMTSKKKIPSPGELYELIHCDIFEAPTRYPDMATRVDLPTVSFANEELKGPKTWRSPDMFVITIALPTDPPKLVSSGSDGGGYTITMYFAMKQETRDILWRVTAAGGYAAAAAKEDDGNSDIQKSKVNAVRLLEEWVRRAPTDQTWFSRFKIVPNAHNLREIGMPSWISKYNGKPFLIKRPGVTGFIFQHPELSVFEFDISLHPFPYLARQGICFLKENFFKKVLVSFGFVIEGRSDDELPECIIGCLQLCYPDPAHAIQAKDFFSGASARSF